MLQACCEFTRNVCERRMFRACLMSCVYEAASGHTLPSACVPSPRAVLRAFDCAHAGSSNGSFMTVWIHINSPEGELACCYLPSKTVRLSCSPHVPVPSAPPQSYLRSALCSMSDRLKLQHQPSSIMRAAQLQGWRCRAFAGLICKIDRRLSLPKNWNFGFAKSWDIETLCWLVGTAGKNNNRSGSLFKYCRDSYGSRRMSNLLSITSMRAMFLFFQCSVLIAITLFANNS